MNYYVDIYVLMMTEETQGAFGYMISEQNR